MKMKLALVLLAGGSMFAQQRFSVGIHVGGYGPGYGSGYYDAPRYGYEQPPCPGPDYYWTDGYWREGYGPRLWVNGLWARRPYYGSGRGFGYGPGIGPGYGYGYRGVPRYENRYRDNRSFGRDDRRGYSRDYREDRGYGNRFRGR